MILRRSCTRHLRGWRSLATLPPRASPDQIFSSAGVSRPGTSLGTEDDWEAALLAQEVEESSSREEAYDGASLFASNRVGQVALPPGLVDATNKVLGRAHLSAIRTTVLRFYESLTLKNEGRTNDTPMPASSNFTSIEADAYITGLMPQVYASVHTVLLELRKRLGKDWTPRTVLDCGVGPGTAGLAFQSVFVDTNPHASPEGYKMTLIEANREMRSRIDDIWSSIHPDVKTGHDTPNEGNNWKVHHKIGSHRYDVILAPHALGDMKGRPAERDTFIKDLYARLTDNGVLVLLERGNPIGFEQVARARQVLLRSGPGHIIAPCPHDGTCPMYRHGHQPDRRQWCHFSQRLQRPDFLQKTKKSKLNMEDVNYSYMILQKSMPRPELPNIVNHPVHVLTPSVRNEVEKTTAIDRNIVLASYHWSRIILPPLKRHKHILVDVCASSKTLQRMTIPKSQGPMEYKFARKSHWGDLIPFEGKTTIDKKEMDVPDRKIRTRRDHTPKHSNDRDVTG